MWLRVLPFLAAALVLVTDGAARATVVRQSSLDELVAESAVVLHGTVRSVDEESTPFTTIIEVDLTERIKGLPASARTFRFTLPGGRSGDLAMYVPGSPRFSPGNEVVLLLARTPQGGFAPAGLGQGVFRVDRAQPVPRVHRELRGAAYVDAQGREASPQAVPDTLPELLTRIRGLVAAGARP